MWKSYDAIQSIKQKIEPLTKESIVRLIISQELNSTNEALIWDLSKLLVSVDIKIVRSSIYVEDPDFQGATLIRNRIAVIDVQTELMLYVEIYPVMERVIIYFDDPAYLMERQYIKVQGVLKKFNKIGEMHYAAELNHLLLN